MQYTVIRTRRRTMCLQILADGSVCIRAPLHTADAVIRSFAEKHAGWIEEKTRLARQRAAREATVTPEQEQVLRRMAKQKLPELTARYADRMGVQPAGVRITGAKTRFGSCSGQNRICYSWRLLLYPEEAVEYVVVHELAHIRHKNHGKEFYAAVAAVMPDYRRRAALLKMPADTD